MGWHKVGIITARVLSWIDFTRYHFLQFKIYSSVSSHFTLSIDPHFFFFSSLYQKKSVVSYHDSGAVVTARAARKPLSGTSQEKERTFQVNFILLRSVTRSIKVRFYDLIDIGIIYAAEPWFQIQTLIGTRQQDQVVHVDAQQCAECEQSHERVHVPRTYYRIRRPEVHPKTLGQGSVSMYSIEHFSFFQTALTIHFFNIVISDSANDVREL